ncbi:MAG: ribulose-phosphate 3-epimerase [bacterium]
MVEIIPAIIAKDLEELKQKIKQVEPYVDWAQLDVMDNQFVDNITWNNPEELMNFKTSINLEAHLMIKNSENHLDNWIKSSVKRIIFHYESTDKHQEIIKNIQNAGLEVGLAINPETEINVVDEFIDKLDVVLIMTVHPGYGGQEFLEGSLNRIKSLREKYSNVKIEVDGGINLETASEVIRAGANILVSGSGIFKGDNVKDTINKLKIISRDVVPAKAGI